MIIDKIPAINDDNSDSLQTEGLIELLPASINQLPFAPDIGLIEDWLSQLPMANAPKTCQVFFEFLRITNGQSIRSEIRLNILEIIKKNLEIVGSALEAHFIDRDLPLDSRAEKFAMLGLNCSRELGEGYRIIMEEIAFAELQRDIQLKVIYRFFECQSGLSLRYAQLYKERPVGFWTALYRAYRIAELMALHNEVLVSDEYKRDRPPTIAVLFLHILLFFLSLTGRYRQQKQQQIYNLLAKFASLSELSEDSQLNNQKAVFAFDFKQDNPPRHVRHMNAESGSVPCYLLTRSMVASMVSSLKTDATITNGEPGVSATQKSLVVELVRNLGAPLRRKAIRVNENEKRLVLVGIQSISAAIVRLDRDKAGFKADRNVHNANPGRKYANTTLYDCGNFSRIRPKISYINVPEYDLMPIEEGNCGKVLSRRPAGLSERSNNEFWKTIRPDSGITSSEIWNEAMPIAEKSAEKHRIKKQKNLCGTLLDSSIRGYALRWDRNTIAQIRVGELIGFPIENKRIELGVIRRICGRDEHLDLGIELLATDVGYFEILANNGKRQPLRGLQFANPPKSDYPGESILIQGSNFSAGELVNLAVRGVNTQVSVGQLLETTVSFRRYTILPLDSNYRKAG